VSWYLLAVYVHIMATGLWIGHMALWVLAGGTITKRFLSPQARAVVVELRDEFGQIGWPSLAVLIVTGAVILYARGVTLERMVSTPFGWALGGKLTLVATMIVLQGFVGPRRPLLGWLDFFIAVMVIGLSVLIVRQFAI
jgi:uncharacterized membrane protein